MAEKEWKAEPVSASSLIPVGGTNFASMKDASQLRSVQASAPPMHRQYDRASTGGALEDNEVGRSALQRVPMNNRVLNNFGLGAAVHDNNKQRRGVIIQASVGTTRKTKTPVHKISDSRGKTWNAKQSDLKLIL